MGSRLREKPEKLFEVFLEIAKPTGQEEEPFIVQSYPEEYEDEEVLKTVPKFAFPCDTERTTVDHFTFVLTELDSTLKYVFCRHATGAQTCLCIVSYLPWFEIFYNLLNTVAEIFNRNDGEQDLKSFLHAAFSQDVPAPSIPVTIIANQNMLNFKTPEPNKLASIPNNRNLTEYYNAVDTYNMTIIFASMLNERRIVMVSKRLSRLTACIHASVALLYPMFWQHIFIPVLPLYLIDYLSAPMPYVIGVHTNLMKKVNEQDLGDAVIVDVDNNTVKTQYDDLENLPAEISSFLKRNLKSEKVKASMQTSGDAIPKAFLLSLVRLIGGYRDALRFKPNEPITFEPEAFVQSRPPSLQPFLSEMLHLQIFRQFINNRLDMLNSGQGFGDIFETESLQYADKLNTQSRYKEWVGSMKKQGNKFQKGGKDVWAGIKEKFKSQGKKAYTGFKARLGDFKKEEENDSPRIGKKSMKQGTDLMPEDVPTFIIGEPLYSIRPPRPPMYESPSNAHRLTSIPSSDRIPHKHLPVEEKSLDDSNADLTYNRVSVNLLADPDIVNVMCKAASAENLRTSQDFQHLLDEEEEDRVSDEESQRSPHKRPQNSVTPPASAPKGINTNRDSFGSVPFIDVIDHENNTSFSNQDTSSSFQSVVPGHSPNSSPFASNSPSVSVGGVSRPKPPPRRLKHISEDIPAIPNRLTMAPTPRPRTQPPIPARRTSLDGGLDASHSKGEALIHLSPEDQHDSFDPISSSIGDLSLNAVNSQSQEDNTDTPPVILRSTKSGSTQPSHQPLLEFDPLHNAFSVDSHSAKQNDKEHSPELLHDWNVNTHLGGHSRIQQLQQQLQQSTPPPTVQLGPMPKKGFVRQTVAGISAGEYHTAQQSPLCPSNFMSPASTFSSSQGQNNNPFTFQINTQKNSPVSMIMTPNRTSSFPPSQPGTEVLDSKDPFNDIGNFVQDNINVNSTPSGKWETFE